MHMIDIGNPNVKVDNNGYVVSYIGSSSRLVLDDPRVVGIGDSVFSGRTSLTEIVAPYVQRVERSAFSNCLNLTSVSMPSLRMIDAAAFNNCKKLDVDLLKFGKIELMGEAAFRRTGITVADLSNDVSTRVAPYAFAECMKLKKVILRDDVQYITKKAFYHCPLLSDINWPKDLLLIDASAFAFSDRLPVIAPQEGLKEIEQEAFYSCGGVKFVTLPKSLAKVERDAFAHLPFGTIIKCSSPNIDKWPKEWSGDCVVVTSKDEAKEALKRAGEIASEAFDAFAYSVDSITGQKPELGPVEVGGFYKQRGSGENVATIKLTVSNPHPSLLRMGDRALRNLEEETLHRMGPESKRVCQLVLYPNIETMTFSVVVTAYTRAFINI